MNRSDWREDASDIAGSWVADRPKFESQHRNRKRPWHVRFRRRAIHNLPRLEARLSSPLGLFFVILLISGITALLSGLVAVAAVFTAAMLGCVACQSRHHSQWLP